MTDPITTSTASALGSSFLYKILVYCFGPTLATIVVMMMTPPQSLREWVAAAISTMIFSISFGAWLIVNIFDVNSMLTETDAMFAGGIYFAAGLPGWFIVRAVFLTMEKERNRTIFEIIKRAREETKNDRP